MNKPPYEYSIRVLLVGKDGETERLLGDTLEEIGYDTIQVGNVAEAEEIIGGTRIDIVMGDPRQDSLSWKEFLENIKKGHPSVLTIFITDLEESERDQYIYSGANGILTKPFRIGIVEELISSVMMNPAKSSIKREKKEKRILIVDDDETILGILNNALTVLGYTVKIARSGKEAIGYFIKEGSDLLITDYIMPEMSGKELISELKKLNKDMPAIMITGYPLAYPPQEAKAEGIDAYLVKPFRIIQLDKIISELFEGK